MSIKTIRTDQRGIAHLVVFGIVTCILVLGSGIAFIRYSQHKADKKQQLQLQAQQEKQRTEQELLKTQEQKDLAAKKASETVPLAPQATPAECSRTETLYVTAKDSLSVRIERSSASRALIFAPYGAAMKVGCLDGEWYASEYKGHVGYSLKSYLSPAKPVVAATPPPPASSVPVHPTSCAPNNADFTIYASVPGGTPTYWLSDRGTRSPLALIPYGQAMTVHCYPDDNIQNMVYDDFWVNPKDVTTTKP